MTNFQLTPGTLTLSELRKIFSATKEYKLSLD
ncbi:MAG: hypothetical protein ACI9N9_000670, partial [Enterobacterales bacterium]